MSQNIENGKLGEHICIVKLIKMGVSCSLAHIDAMDIVVHHEGRMIRVQVKSSTLKYNGKKTKSYQFAVCHTGKKIPLTEAECDVVALVAVDCERVLFLPVGCVKGNVTKRIQPQKFDKLNLEQRSWQYCLDRIFLSD